MTNETLKMQMLAGIITESEYKAKLQENKSVNDIIRNLSSTYDLSTFESFKDEIEYSDLMDEIIAQMNGGVELDYNNMDQDEINNLVDPIKKQVDDYVFEKFNKKIFNKTSSFENKDSLNEHFIGMGAINSPFIERKKETYEDAFEHFLGGKYDLKENEETNSLQSISNELKSHHLRENDKKDVEVIADLIKNNELQKAALLIQDLDTGIKELVLDDIQDIDEKLLDIMFDFPTDYLTTAKAKSNEGEEIEKPSNY